MTWHYRVGHMKEGDEDIFGIVEFYDASQVEVSKGMGEGWTDFVHPQSDSIQGLRWDLLNMLLDTARDETPIELTSHSTQQR